MLYRVKHSLIITVLLIISTCCTPTQRTQVNTSKKITINLKKEKNISKPIEVLPKKNIGVPVVQKKKITIPHPYAPKKTPKEVTTLAKRIIKWKKRIDHNIWFECGKRYNTKEIETAAYQWAAALTKAHKNTSYKLRRGRRKGQLHKINLGEAIGIIINESRFDRCAVGPHPRKFAYKKGLLKKKKRTNSHTLSELKKVFNHPRFKGRLADLGPGQIVVRIPKKENSWDTIKDYLTIEPGIDKVFKELAYRGHLYNTTKPSSRWPGSANHKWYTKGVLRQSHYLLNHKL